MNPITHALTGWCVAESVPSLDTRGRAIVVAASLLPDIDGFGILPELLTRNTTRPLFWWTDYHHMLAHNLPAALVAAILAAAFARTKRMIVAGLAFLAVHLHLLGDLAGSRGPDGYNWPIPYFQPFSPEPSFAWSGQWALNAWQNVGITILLLAVTFVLGWRRGYSPLSFVSPRADAAFVGALRARFPRASGAER